MLEDLNDPQDEDTFANRPPNHVRRVLKAVKNQLKENKKKKKKKNRIEGQRQNAKAERNMENKGWYSDLENKDDLQSLRDSYEDIPEHPNRTEEMMRGDYELCVGLKFPTRKRFRDILSHLIVRKGWDLKFEKKMKNITVLPHAKGV